LAWPQWLKKEKEKQKEKEIIYLQKFFLSPGKDQKKPG